MDKRHHGTGKPQNQKTKSPAGSKLFGGTTGPNHLNDSRLSKATGDEALQLLGEDDESLPGSDVWLQPLDARLEAAHSKTVFKQIWDLFVVVISLGQAALGISLLRYFNWKVGDPNHNELWWFVVITLTLELTVWGCTLFSMLVITLVLGRIGLQYSLTFISIFNEVAFGLCYGICGVWGVQVLLRVLQGINYNPQAMINRNADHWYHAVNGQVVCPIVYVGFTAVDCIGYTVVAVPAVWGGMKFICAQLMAKCRNAPIVQFYEQHNRGDEYYVRVQPIDEVTGFVTSMRNPIVVAGGSSSHHQRTSPNTQGVTAAGGRVMGTINDNSQAGLLSPSKRGRPLRSTADTPPAMTGPAIMATTKFPSARIDDVRREWEMAHERQALLGSDRG